MILSVLITVFLSAWGLAISDISSVSASMNLTSYAPIRTNCPQNITWVRPAGTLSNEEAEWVRGRKKQVLKGLEAYVKNLHLIDFDHCEYFDRLRQNAELVPVIAYALSGGAWASALTGTGPLRAFDARYRPAVQQ